MVKLIATLTLFTLLSSCSHYVMRSYPQKEVTADQNCDVALIRIHPPDSIADKVGEIIMDDLGLSINCSEDETIDYLKKEACSLNAQIILIKEIQRSDLESYCYRCTGAFYKLKSGANPVQTLKYFDQERINKREQKDRKKKISRTMLIIHGIRHWTMIILRFGRNHPTTHSYIY